MRGQCWMPCDMDSGWWNFRILIFNVFFQIFEFSNVFLFFRIFEFLNFRVVFQFFEFSNFWIFEFSCYFFQFFEFSNFWIFEFSGKTLPYSRNRHVTKKNATVHLDTPPWLLRQSVGEIPQPTELCPAPAAGTGGRCERCLPTSFAARYEGHDESVNHTAMWWNVTWIFTVVYLQHPICASL